MSFSDPIADLLSRIKNAAKAGHEVVAIPHSRMKESVVKIICDEGFLDGYEVIGEGVQKSIVASLKYRGETKEPVFSGIQRVSKPGRRNYIGMRDIKPSRQGMGISILSTSKGIMKDVDAKRYGVGGELLCTIW